MNPQTRDVEGLFERFEESPRFPAHGGMAEPYVPFPWPERRMAGISEHFEFQ